MDFSGNYLKNINEGMEVEINPQKDKTRKERVSGIVKSILSKTSEHTHGILVELVDGEIGRIKRIINDTLDPNNNIVNNHINETQSKFDVSKLIDASEDENHFVEFKTSILWSSKYSDMQIQESTSFEVRTFGRNASKFIIAKSIASFLNSNGGHLFIGVKENKTDKKNEIVGIESEFSKLKDPCRDGYRRMIVDQIVAPFFSTKVLHHINDYINISFEELDNKTVCHIQILPSKIKIYIYYKAKGYFFIRIDASSRELHGEDIVDYCLKRFVF